MYIVYLKETKEIIRISYTKFVDWSDNLECVEGTEDNIVVKNGVKYYQEVIAEKGIL